MICSVCNVQNLYPSMPKQVITVKKLLNDSELLQTISAFRLPRYHELPSMGLYLEQTTNYMNQCLAPLGCITVTNSMIRNYVKMGIVRNPVKKQYDANHIAHLLGISVLKTVVSLDQIGSFFCCQQRTYTDETAYNYFIEELENLLAYQFGLKDELDTIGITETMEKEMLRSAIAAVAHIIYLNACHQQLQNSLEKNTKLSDSSCDPEQKLVHS